MTNEEKVLKLAIEEYPVRMVEDSNGREYDWNADYRDSYRDGALAMAERFKEYLEKNRSNWPEFMNGTHDYAFGMKEGYVKAFDKINDEFFGEN